jgi:protein TonB
MRLKVQQAERRGRNSRAAALLALMFALGATPAHAAAAPADPVPVERVPINREAPKYPAGAELRGITGWVLIEFAVDGQGNVVFPRIVEASPPGVFDSVALRAVANWKYQPTGSNSQGVQVNMKFELK